jgi:PIN domain nuclease of toxin-antitoxin system
LIDDSDNDLLFSAASVLEVAIKRGLGRDDFKVDASLLRRGLLDNGYSELPIHSQHVIATESLPPIHKDPFDRVLVAQAVVEGITLLTIDSRVARYPGPIRIVAWQAGENSFLSRDAATEAESPRSLECFTRR